MPFTAADTAIIEGLRTRIAVVERREQPISRAAALPFGLDAIDAHLPRRSLQLGAVPDFLTATFR